VKLYAAVKPESIVPSQAEVWELSLKVYQLLKWRRPAAARTPSWCSPWFYTAGELLYRV